MEYKTRQWHEKCFVCCTCKNPIGTKSFIPKEQEIYCAKCYEDKFATKCTKCKKVRMTFFTFLNGGKKSVTCTDSTVDETYVPLGENVAKVQRTRTVEKSQHRRRPPPLLVWHEMFTLQICPYGSRADSISSSQLDLKQPCCIFERAC